MKRNKEEYPPPTEGRNMQDSRAARNVSFTHPFIQEMLIKLGFLLVLFVCLFLLGLGIEIETKRKHETNHTWIYSNKWSKCSKV